MDEFYYYEMHVGSQEGFFIRIISECACACLQTYLGFTINVKIKDQQICQRIVE